MRGHQYFLTFLAVLGTALMLSPIAAQVPGGDRVGWGVVAFSWITAFLFWAFTGSDEQPKQ